MSALDFRRDVDHYHQDELLWLSAPLMIIAVPTGHQQDLPALMVVDVTVVAATQFKDHVDNDNALGSQHIQIALSGKILCKRFVFIS